MNTKQTKIHHAIIDLYEVDDADEVTAKHISVHTGLSLRDIETLLSELSETGIIAMQDGVVVQCYNAGYYPLAQK